MNNFLCVDDQADSIAELLAALNRANESLNIEPCVPKEFEAMTTTVMQRYNDTHLDGLLIDLRLDEPGPGAEPVRYTAQGLAQQLRSLCAEYVDASRGFPIVLWTVNERLLRLYEKDSTGHDLFDAILDKEKLLPKVQEIAKELVYLAEGYKNIAKDATNKRGFGEIVQEPEEGFLDPRIGDAFSEQIIRPTHEYALHIIRYLIERPGPLIDRNHLLARFGIARESPDIDALFEKVPAEAKYKGPFSNGWSRWWSALIERWWRDVAGDEELRALTAIGAPERVSILKKKLGLDRLLAAEPIEEKYSNRFTTICQSLCLPLDPVDGFALAERMPKPWLEKRYVSGKVALSPAKYNFREPLDGLELKRLERLILATQENGGQERSAES